ncbi:MAG: response regulator [Clostridia bacterium]|nr:response regulator [Clostridia bacterium]
MYSVLLVDDCATDLEGLVSNVNWSALGCEIVGTAQNGEEGFNKAAELNPQIVITDVSMPKTDGIAMTKQIQEILPDTNFIYISCFDEFTYVKSAMDNNVSAYVLKPIKIEEIEKAIAKITGLLAKSLETQKRTRRTASTLENFLSDMLFGSELDQEYAMLLGIPFNDKYRVGLIKFRDNCGLKTDRMYSELAEIKSLCIAGSGSEYNYFLEFGVDSLVLLVHEDSKNETDFVSYLNMICRQAPSPDKITCEYQAEAVPFISIHKVFDMLSSGSKSKNELADNSVMLNELNTLLVSGTHEEISDFADRYLPQNEDINRLKTISVQIVNTVTFILSEHNTSFSEIFDDEFVIWNKLFNFRSIVNIRQLITNLLLSARECLAEKSVKLDKYEGIASDIKSFIDRNFASPTIVEDVAQSVHLSVNHTNSIFKKVTGQTLFNYTVSRRMESAKVLMHDKALSISDIAIAVGYVNSAHFATVFKKNTGMAPSQYRNSL